MVWQGSAITLALVFSAACAPESPAISEVQQSVVSPDVRRHRAESIRDVALTFGVHRGSLLGGIAQAETGFAHCWSEAQWACMGPDSPSCGGGPVIAGAGDGPCELEQGGLGLFQFDGGTFAQTLARDGEEILLLEGNIAHALEFVLDMVVADVDGVTNWNDAAEWLSDINVASGDSKFEAWIDVVTCRYNGCCSASCGERREHYRSSTLAVHEEFGSEFWQGAEQSRCAAVPAEGRTIEESDDCWIGGGDKAYFRVENAGSDGELIWTHTTASEVPANYGQWELRFNRSGYYTVEAYTDSAFAQSTQASYKVVHDSEFTLVVVDQTKDDGYQMLGEFYFAADGDQYVRLDDNTGEASAAEVQLVFDAIRVLPVSLDDEEPGQGDVGGGCSSAPAAPTASWWLLALLLFATRRRRVRRV